MKIVPADICIKRYYRGYAKVPEETSDEQIIENLYDQIVSQQDDAIDLDPGMEIEGDDICYVTLDHEGSWTEEEDEEITRILSDDLMKELERGVDTVCGECCFISETNCMVCPVRRSLDIHKENRRSKEV